MRIEASSAERCWQRFHSALSISFTEDDAARRSLEPRRRPPRPPGPPGPRLHHGVFISVAQDFITGLWSIAVPTKHCALLSSLIILFHPRWLQETFVALVTLRFCLRHVDSVCQSVAAWNRSDRLATITCFASDVTTAIAASAPWISVW